MGFVRGYLLELDSLEALKLTPPTIDHTIWEPPAPGTVKVNCDASFQTSTRSSSSTNLVRNDMGQVMAACVYLHNNIPDAFTAEATLVYLILGIWDFFSSKSR